MLNNLQGKKILLGVSGGIAAYKAAELIRLLKSNGAEVRVVMTKSAMEFVQPLTFSTLSGNSVSTEMFQQDLEVKIEHVALARWADAVIIAPATANVIAKLSYGLADDLLSTVCLATTAPICIAPAMNMVMWAKEVTQNNIELLKRRGVKVFGPASGDLACGEIGCGKLLEPSILTEMLAGVFTKPILKGVKIIVTAGPTI